MNAESISSSRECPFKKDANYRIKTSFVALRDKFTKGETLTYQNDEYSRYDSITGYFFIDQKGKIRVWDIYDDEPIDSWLEYFEKE